jgi:hypothetical protein
MGVERPSHSNPHDSTSGQHARSPRELVKAQVLTSARRLVGHVLDTGGALVACTPEHFVHALTRDAERTGKLGLGGARLVRVEQGAAKIPAGSVETLKRVECFPVCAQHSLDFGVVCDGRTISQRGCLPLARQG